VNAMGDAANRVGGTVTARNRYMELPYASALTSDAVDIAAPAEAESASSEWPAAGDHGGVLCQWHDSGGSDGAAQVDHGVSWATSAADSNTLTLHEWSLTGSVPPAALRLTFAAPLLPTAAAWSDDASAVLYVLTADAALYSLRLQRSAHAGQPLLQSLAAADASAVESIVFPLANSIGRPTSLAAVADAVCIGGSSGAVACLPLACFTEQLSIRSAVQLAPASDGIVTRLGRAFWGGVTQPAVVDLAPAPFLGPHMLMALYADASLRFWDTKVRQQLYFRAMQCHMACQHSHVGDCTQSIRNPISSPLRLQAAVPTATVQSLASLAPNSGAFASTSPVRLRAAASDTVRQVLLAVELRGSGDAGLASAVEVYTVHFEGRSAGLQHAATLQVHRSWLVNCHEHRVALIVRPWESPG
jgi:Nucleoporin Nup120/160